MSLPAQPLHVVPVVSVLYGDASELNKSLVKLKNMLGNPVLVSESFPFDMTDYYEPEMGRNLVRTWFCFPLRDPSELPDWKLACISIEETAGGEGSRRANLDPGYLDHGKLVLASCKEAPDKIYLRDGVWAHTCLRYRSGSFYGPDHSFADFIDGRFNSFFIEVKRLYRKLLREQ
ncbi:hypothetical protein CSA37_03975 [Candidatus Fermentibacteria bacterium]|nr:MAG: hypothetical protein CSA37_10740 [Candidatus Fermentibacteria bacterium]PIE52810.1 MAG: hypothetical protein CSA37_03975 [Candidatus Fermentibacteria bacterium]